MLGAVRYSSEIARPADDVWAMVGEPARIGDWFPDFASATVEGTTRTIVTKSGMTFDEELLIVDPILRRLQYRLDLPIISFHRGTIDVIGGNIATGAAALHEAEVHCNGDQLLRSGIVQFAADPPPFFLLRSQQMTR